MNRIRQFTIAGFCLILLLACRGALAEQQTANVVLIVIDDLGWRDLGCYGSQYYQTPNIDRLAADGMRFTDGYAACNVCSPSRASLLTGKYPARLMLTQWLPGGRWDSKKNKLREARYLSHLPLEEVTLAEAMRAAGYRTALVGKWHLGGPPYSFPEQHGFDLNMGGRDYGAPGSYFYPFQGKWKIPTTKQTAPLDSPVDGKPGDYLTDCLTDEAVKFIRAEPQKPFFLMLSHYAVHAPLEGKPEKLSRYQQVSKNGRQGDPEYAAMIESVDDSVGRVMKVLEEQQLADNTLVIFTSDNGGYAKATSNAPLRANKGSNYEGGLRVPVICRWPGKIKSGSVSAEPIIGTDFYPMILAAIGQKLRPHQHLDGENLLPLLTGSGNINREALFWHYPHYNQHPESFPSGAIRKGKWKLIESFESKSVALFNLEQDLGETTDVAHEQPQIATELSRMLNDWRTEVGADPMRPNPEYGQGN